MRKKETGNRFHSLLKHYLSIKGLDIIVILKDGKRIELHKNRSMTQDEIVVTDRHNREMRIPIAAIKSIDLFAA